MISVTTEISPPDKDGRQRPLLVISGRFLRSRWQFSRHGRRLINAYDEDDSAFLSTFSFADLAPHFALCELGEFAEWNELRVLPALSMSNAADPSTWAVFLRFALKADEWTGPWSIAAYKEALMDALASHPLPEAKPTEDDSYSYLQPHGFGVACPIRSAGAIVGEEVEHWLGVVRPVVEQVRATLSAQVRRDSLIELFKFPPAISTACEQYLLYFVQFLRDLGIEADASIKHEAHWVLFSVTPREGAEALDRIRQALEAYLRIPSTLDLDAAAERFPDPAVRQLQANVYHLKSQLALAGAVLQAKGAHIEMLELTNFRYQQLLANAGQVGRLSPLRPAGEYTDEEPLIPGMVTLVPLQGKGFKLDLPAILRRLKRLLNDTKDQWR